MHHINWAVLGCGHIAKTFMQSIKKVEQANVVACAASNEERAKQFAKDHNIKSAFGDYDSMLSERNIRAVYIATTHNFHFDQIINCLQHGKHVLCEKPLTLNAEQAKQAFDLAAANNLMLVEAVWTRFLPAIRSVQALIASGTIGEVLCVNANFSLNRDLPDTHRLKNKKLAGGALLDLGIYPITIADIVFAQAPKKITSSVIMTKTGVDQNSFYTIKYEGGKTAQLSAGFKMSGPTEATIMGDKGFIRIPFFLGAKSYEINIEGEAPQTCHFDFEDGANFSFEIAHMTDFLLNDNCESDIHSAESTLRVMKIMDEIRGQWGLAYQGEE